MGIEGKPVKRERNRDRLSELPEFIIHQILSYLHTKEAARTTVLSKTWLQPYSTSPILNFNEQLFSKSPRIEETRYLFFNLVNNTLLRYHSQNLRIHKLKITVSCVYHAPAYRLLLDESLGLAFDNAVQELDILILRADMFSLYTLPPTMFDSPKALTYLSVYKCKFPKNFATTSRSNATIFPYLKTLNLHSVIIDDVMLRKLLSGSASLEEININRVSGLKEFKVTNLGKLKTFNIGLIHDNNTVKIDIEDAPSLCCLKYRHSLKLPCLLKVGRAQNLKNLELQEVSISDSFLNELITKFPSLEELKFYACNGFERINIVNDSLKHLKLAHCKNLVEAKIDAPSLLELEYSTAGNALSLSLYNTPQELMTSIRIDITHDRSNRPTNAWFHRLRALLKSVTQARVSFCIWHQRIRFHTALDNRANPLPLEHQSENFMPELNPSSSLFAVFLDTLFLSSRPTTITCLLAPASVIFVKFLGGELITATRNPNCCSCVQTKCWRHYLKDIKVEVC